MAKIDITSDVHWDSYIPFHLNKQQKIRWFECLFQAAVPKNNSNTLLISGDLSHYNNLSLQAFEILKSFYKDIVFIHGNHDLYLPELFNKVVDEQYGNNSFNRLNELITLSKKIPNVHYLNGDIINIDGIKILGSCFWYDYSYGEKYFQKPKFYFDRLWESWSDNRFSRNKGERFDCLTYFESQLEKLKVINEEVDVVMSHMLPLNELVENKFAFDETTAFFVFDGREIIRKFKPKVWVFGHTHSPFDNIIGNTRFINNALGYAPTPFWTYNTSEYIRPFKTIEI